MKISKTSFTIELSELELKCAIEEYYHHKHNERIAITNLKHLIGERTEGYGMCEIDVPYQEGVRVVAQYLDK